jgi:hypothetical protein
MMSIISLDPRTQQFFRKVKIEDLNPILTHLREVPLSEREMLFVELTGLFGFRKKSLMDQFTLLCK